MTITAEKPESPAVEERKRVEGYLSAADRIDGLGLGNWAAEAVRAATHPEPGLQTEEELDRLMDALEGALLVAEMQAHTLDEILRVL